MTSQASHGREAVQVHASGVLVEVQQVGRAGQAQEEPRRGEALQMPPVPQVLRQERPSGQARQNTQVSENELFVFS